MATAGHSRRRGGTPPSDGSRRLFDLLRAVANIATGKSHRGRSKHHHRRSNHEPRLQATRARPAAWFVKRDVSTGRLAAAAVLALAFIWIGWRIVADTAAQNLAQSAPAEALRWKPGTGAALDQRSLSELKKSDGDVSAAETWARQALRARPLDQYALFLLGMAADRKGDANGALSLMREAGSRTWRNPGTQLWLFEHAAKRGDFSTALRHADAIFRVDPNFLTPMFPTIAAFTVEPRGLQALADFLATSPPWRDTVLLLLSARLYDKSHLDQLYSILMQSPSPPTTRELEAYLDRLIKDGRYEAAYRTWREATRVLPASAPEFPYNGDFERPADGLPFNWSAGSVPGADVSIVPADDAKGRALRVEFSGARVRIRSYPANAAAATRPLPPERTRARRQPADFARAMVDRPVRRDAGDRIGPHRPRLRQPCRGASSIAISSCRSAARRRFCGSSFRRGFRPSSRSRAGCGIRRCESLRCAKPSKKPVSNFPVTYCGLLQIENTYCDPRPVTVKFR